MWQRNGSVDGRWKGGIVSKSLVVAHRCPLRGGMGVGSRRGGTVAAVVVIVGARMREGAHILSRLSELQLRGMF